MSNIINEPINVSIKWWADQTVTTFYETMTEHCSNQIKNIMQAQIETSASALGSEQTISSFKAFGEGQQKRFEDKHCFILFFYTFLFWHDWIQVLA